MHNEALSKENTERGWAGKIVFLFWKGFLLVLALSAEFGFLARVFRFSFGMSRSLWQEH